MRIEHGSARAQQRHRFCGAEQAVLLIGMTLLLIGSDTRLDLQADDVYNEVLVPPLTTKTSQGAEPVSKAPALPPPLQPIAESLAPPSAPCNCGKTSSGDPGIYVSAFGGASYFETPPDTSLGGLYGMFLSVPLQERLGVIASGQVNNYGGGTQYGGTVGTYVNTEYYGELWERFGGTIAVDQMTDTGLGSPYLAQGRFTAAYRILPGVLASVQYTDPLTTDVKVVIPSSGTATYRGAHVTQGMLTIGGSTLGIGYVDEERSMTYTFMNSRHLTDRLSSILNTTYDENIGLWTGFVGIQVELSAPRAERWVAGNSRRNNGDIIRGASFIQSEALMAADDLEAAQNAARQEAYTMQAIQQMGARARTATPQSGSKGSVPCSCNQNETDNGLSGTGSQRVRFCYNQATKSTRLVPCPE